MGRVRSPKRRVRDDDFILGYRRIIVGYPRIVFLLAEALQGVSDEILSFKISWQAQYLVRLEGDFSCSAHWKWRFICAADRWWHWFCVAGAAFGEVGCWLYLLRALEMTFHMWCGSSMTLVLCGRRSIWWGWMLTLLAPRIGNDVAYVMRIVDDIDFSWQAHHFVTFSEMATTRNVVFYNTKSSPSWDESGLRSGGCEMTILCSDYRRIILESSFYWRKHSGSFRWNLELEDFVAGAVFGEVGGSLYLLHELEMRFHMWRRSLMTFILRGRRSIWWGWRVTFRDRRSTSWHFGR